MVKIERDIFFYLKRLSVVYFEVRVHLSLGVLHVQTDFLGCGRFRSLVALELYYDAA